MISIATHIKIPIAERIERSSQNLSIEKTVLREDIQFTVRDKRSREEQLVFRLISKVMHTLALCTTIFLEFVGFVRDYEVCIVCHQLFFKPPCTLVIHNHDLQAFTR